MVVERARAAFHLVEVSVGQSVLVEVVPVGLFDRKVQPLKIAAVLVRAVFGGVGDDSEVDEICIGSRNARKIEQFESDGLEQSLLAAVQIVALLNDGREVQLVPRRIVFIPVVVEGLEFVAAVEVELPHVLAHGVTPGAAAGSIADMVVHLAVVDQRALPTVLAPAVFPGRRVGDVL